MKLLFSDTVAENQLDQVISQVKPYLKPRTLILLEGDLGAGKTTFVRELMVTLNYNLANSPTYALRQTYQTKTQHVEHLDLYRLENEEDVDGAGIWDLFQNEKSLILVEWPGHVDQNNWPMNWQKYYLKITPQESKRKYEFYEI